MQIFKNGKTLHWDQLKSVGEARQHVLNKDHGGIQREKINQHAARLKRTD